MPLSIGLLSIGTLTLFKRRIPSELVLSTSNRSTWECRDVPGSKRVQVGFRRNTEVKNRTHTMRFPMPLSRPTCLKKWQGMSALLNNVMVWIRSLNHAFTVTSRRLQPHRRGHGGRIYDHIAWSENNRWVSL